MDRMNWFYHYFNSGISFTSLLVVYLVNSLKNSPFKRVFVIFFYLHSREQGKTRSSCRWQSTFPPWPRGKGNCLQDCPTSFDFGFGWFADRSSPTEVSEDLILTRSVVLIGPRSTENSSQSWAWSAGKH